MGVQSELGKRSLHGKSVLAPCRLPNPSACFAADSRWNPLCCSAHCARAFCAIRLPTQPAVPTHPLARPLVPIPTACCSPAAHRPGCAHTGCAAWATPTPPTGPMLTGSPLAWLLTYRTCRLVHPHQDFCSSPAARGPGCTRRGRTRSTHPTYLTPPTGPLLTCSPLAWVRA